MDPISSAGLLGFVFSSLAAAGDDGSLPTIPEGSRHLPPASGRLKVLGRARLRRAGGI
jgi:hypothetical protein